MDIDLSFSISYSIDFASIPKGAKEYAELIRSNAKTIVRDRINEYVTSSFSTSLNESFLQRIIENTAQTECAINSSVAQSKRTQDLIAELSDGIIVTVSISRTADDIINQIKEAVTSKIKTAIRM